MVKRIRETGFNGNRLVKLRRSERWSQGDLAQKLGVHRATVVRWESCLIDPPLDMANKLVELFGVPREWFYKHDQDTELSEGIVDPFLKKIALYDLQKWTAPALKLLRKSAASLALKVEISIVRIQEILDGARPSSKEIQLFRDGLGPDFNPSPTLMKRINPRPDSASQKLDQLMDRVARLEQTQSAILQKLDQLLELCAG